MVGVGVAAGATRRDMFYRHAGDGELTGPGDVRTVAARVQNALQAAEHATRGYAFATSKRWLDRASKLLLAHKQQLQGAPLLELGFQSNTARVKNTCRQANMAATDGLSKSVLRSVLKCVSADVQLYIPTRTQHTVRGSGAMRMFAAESNLPDTCQAP